MVARPARRDLRAIRPVVTAASWSPPQCACAALPQLEESTEVVSSMTKVRDYDGREPIGVTLNPPNSEK